MDIKIEPCNGWCIFIPYRNSDGGFLASSTFSSTRKGAQENVCRDFYSNKYTWRQLYRRDGYRAIRATLTAPLSCALERR